MLLSDRMQAVAGLVKTCHCMADIGCDHGYVAMELVKRHTCEHIIAMDINHGPLESAKNNIRAYEMQDYISTRISDGTQALNPGEVDGIICAGMGGRLIIHILTEGEELIRGMKQLILQPQSEIDEVRSYLRENGFVIEKEDMVCEDGKYYPMMRVIPESFGKQEKQIAENLNHAQSAKIMDGEPPCISETSMEKAIKKKRIQDTYGPYLLKKAHPVLKQYLLWQKENLENIRGNLMNQKTPNARQQYRIVQLDEELGDIVFCLYEYFS